MPATRHKIQHIKNIAVLKSSTQKRVKDQSQKIKGTNNRKMTHFQTLVINRSNKVYDKEGSVEWKKNVSHKKFQNKKLFLFICHWNKMRLSAQVDINMLKASHRPNKKREINKFMFVVLLILLPLSDDDELGFTNWCNDIQFSFIEMSLFKAFMACQRFS